MADLTLFIHSQSQCDWNNTKTLLCEENIKKHYLKEQACLILNTREFAKLSVELTMVWKRYLIN